MSEVTFKSLGELTVNLDSRRVPIREADRKPGPYPYYGASGIVDRVEGYLFDGEYLLIAEDGENLRTRQTPIAFLARGKFWVNNHAHVVEGNEYADTRYLLYALNAAEISPYLTGSTMPKLTQANLNRIPIPYRTLQEQREVAKVLSALDDKIELNCRVNETLEAMARAVFKDWFIDFGPVRAKTEGRQPPALSPEIAALFPNRLDEEGKPQSWRYVPLLQLCSTLSKGTTPRKESVETAADAPSIPFIKVRDLDEAGNINRRQLEHIPRSVHEGVLKRSILRSNDILFSIAGTIGRVAVVDERLSDSNTNQAIAFIRLSDPLKHLGIVLQSLKSDYVLSEARAVTVQGVQANVSLSSLGQFKILVPSENVLSAWNEQFWSIHALQRRYAHQLETLVDLRDFLLRKLLSGELRISSAEKQIEQVA